MSSFGNVGNYNSAYSRRGVLSNLNEAQSGYWVSWGTETMAYISVNLICDNDRVFIC